MTKPVTPLHPAHPSADPLKRLVLMTILALSWVGSGVAWTLMESLGHSSPVLSTSGAGGSCMRNLVYHRALHVP